MNFNDYQTAAIRTNCDESLAQLRLRGELGTLAKADVVSDNVEFPAAVLHGLLGLQGEVGELSDAVKKWLYYGRSLDRTHVAEELGDVLWYLSRLAEAYGLNLGDIAAGNIAKLKTRYPDKFVDVVERDSQAEYEAVKQGMTTSEQLASMVAKIMTVKEAGILGDLEKAKKALASIMVRE